MSLIPGHNLFRYWLMHIIKWIVGFVSIFLWEPLSLPWYDFLMMNLFVFWLIQSLLLLQLCLTLCDPIDGNPPGSPVPGILQVTTLEWIAISFSKAWKWRVKGKALSCVWLFETPWTIAYQAPPSMGFSRQEYWNGLPLPSPYSVIR